MIRALRHTCAWAIRRVLGRHDATREAGHLWDAGFDTLVIAKTLGISEPRALALVGRHRVRRA